MIDSKPMRSLVEFAIGGGWGSEQPEDGLVPVSIIRGADFPDVERGDYAGLPLRYEKASKVTRRRLMPGDIVLEVSGGTKDRPTGRAVFVSQTSLDRSAATLIPASFCRLIRPDSDEVDPKYLYYWLVQMHRDGRTWGYQVQSTGLANFQFETFLDAEEVRLPPLQEQRRIAGVLGALDDLVDTNQRLIRLLTAQLDATFQKEFGGRPLGIPVGDFADVVDCLHSKKPQRQQQGRLLLQLANIRDDGLLSTDDQYLITEADYTRWTRNLETRPWDCVITNVGRVGAVARVPVGVAAALGRNMTAIRPRSPSADGGFLLAGLRSKPVRQEIDARTDSGTVMNALNVRSIPFLRLPEASEAEREMFSERAAAVLPAADALLAENRRVVATRDELLPLLLSGRVSPGEVAA